MAVELNAMNAADLNGHLAGDISTERSWGFWTVVKIGDNTLAPTELTEIANKAISLTQDAWAESNLETVTALNGRVSEIKTAVDTDRAGMWTLTRMIMSAINFIFGDRFQGIFDASKTAESYAQYEAMLQGDERGSFLHQIYSIERAAAEAAENDARVQEMDTDAEWAANNVRNVNQATLQQAYEAVVADRQVAEDAAV